MHHEVAPLTARLRISLFCVSLNKVHDIFKYFSCVLSLFSRVFLNSGSYAFVTFLLYRENLISQSFKKIGDSVTVHSPCQPTLQALQVCNRNFRTSCIIKLGTNKLIPLLLVSISDSLVWMTSN